MFSSKNCVDGQTHSFSASGSQIIEAKTGPFQPADSFRLRQAHLFVLAALIASVIFVPQFLMGFLMLILCVVLSLICFVFLVQMPMRFFVSRLKNRSRAETNAEA
ncbi:MAG: hypothetical protein GY768_08095 [Planctomycetaceae bacterium]|nr:hypothetical protein [Planctomycetaceae bacterium]